jgi:predicted SprT family Zn-dependent metalloprotease
MGRRYLTIFDGNGFINKAKVTINMDVKGNEFDTATIGQVAKHEICHGIGLSDTNFDGIFFHGRKGQ